MGALGNEKPPFAIGRSCCFGTETKVLRSTPARFSRDNYGHHPPVLERLSEALSRHDPHPGLPGGERDREIHFHQINRKTGHRLRQQMVDERTGKVVEKEDKGRGYELGKGKYVEIEPDELAAVEVESTHTIDIDKFVPEDEIDRRYYDKPYYIAPDGKTGVDAFAVIRDAMKDKKRVALARIVMANREHVIALEPFDKGFLGTTLRYDYEVRDAKDYLGDIPTPHIDREMSSNSPHTSSTARQVTSIPRSSRTNTRPRSRSS